MTGKAHLSAGTMIGLTYVVTIHSDDFIYAAPFLIGTMIGSLFPDIDSKNSKISNRFQILSFCTRLFVGHRGVLHTPIGVIITVFILNFIGLLFHIPNEFYIGFLQGACVI